MSDSLLIDRGFTGHEHYNVFELIDMNGRVYDPVLGRFLSPDPVIQPPDFTQSYNSYSYCFNNPLKYSDPTGYTAVKIAKENREKFLTQAGAVLSLEFLCEIYKSNDPVTDEELIELYLISMGAVVGGGGPNSGNTQRDF